MARTRGFGRARDRRRRQMLLRWGSGVLAILVFVAVGAWSYKTGSQLARGEVTGLANRLSEASAQIDAIQQQRIRLETELAQQRTATEALQRKYDDDVPSGAFAEIVALARQKVTSGVQGDRLKDALRATENVKPCTGRVVTKRIAVVSKHTADDGVSFADGLIQVSATMPAGGEGVARPITITFTHAAGGADITASGLPVRQSIVLDNAELQFNVAASDLSGYVVAALTTCSRT